MRMLQKERPFARNPETHVILGAEEFEVGKGEHAVLFIHGWTSTPRELKFLAGKVAEAGFHCRGIRLKGHGLTVKALLNVTWRDFLTQCQDAFSELAANHRSVSVCGLSMGALLSLHLAARRKVANLVLLSPFIHPFGNFMGVIPNRWIVPKLPEFITSIGKDITGAINDPDALKEHIAYHEMPTRELMSIMEGVQAVLPILSGLANPTLILHSLRDKTSDFSGSVEVLRALASDDKTLVAINKSNHVITLDFDREKVEREVVQWLVARR